MWMLQNQLMYPNYKIRYTLYVKIQSLFFFNLKGIFTIYTICTISKFDNIGYNNIMT